jgi:small subunit ribosomal protein S19e|eukprot:gnl/Ergobibamus_cyprinoides/381.p1 GENE.gnl/Ergobibamus_cyprinoides/381~~gnl/Ergobibamus_cyprinoides/381.p1  ORF type:complete len:156 (+),score=67.82 gnl/Ergobibamus_cyprinoides/381:37-468(+)
MSGSVLLRDVKADEFVRAYAHSLKVAGKVTPPKWADLAKTGFAKEMSPLDADWYYIRVASIARRVAMRAHTGVGGLRSVYGQNSSHGRVTPKHHVKASGAVIRHAMQQLEAAGILQKSVTGRGRMISAEGQRDMDRVAAAMKL